jgi:hypothetical protein
MIFPSCPPRAASPPWTVDDHAESFIVRDANGQQVTLRF